MSSKAGSPTPRRAAIIDELMQASREQMRLSILWGSAVAEVIGIHATDATSVTFLLEAGEATAGELARVTGLTTGAMTAAIDRLERAGLAQRLTDPNDRRKVIVRAVKIPPELAALRDSMRAEFQETLEQYSDAELRRFVELSTAVNEMIKKAMELRTDKRVKTFIRRRDIK